MRKGFQETFTCLPGINQISELELRIFSEEKGQILEGALMVPTGDWYPIIGGVPCLLGGTLRPDFSWFQEKYGLPAQAVVDTETLSTSLETPEEEQRETTKTFSDKWRRFKSYGLEESHQPFLFDWYCKKFGLSDLDALKKFYQSKKSVLEIGPGSGFNTRFIAEQTSGEVFAADISEAALTTFENTKDLPNCHVVQADLMALPFADKSFDFIIADGVLHHTPNTQKALFAIYKKLKPGGQLFFYVYQKMGAARQFCDRYIREHFTQLDPESCYEACEGITELGRELSRLDAKITLEKPIPVLGIPAGTHNVQRLLYYNFIKCFWNDAFDYDTNNMVNFDWYHPHNAWQHTEEEVKGWLQELGVQNYSFNPANPNGISVMLQKPES